MITAGYIDALQIHRAPPNPALCPHAISQLVGLGTPPPRRLAQAKARSHGSTDQTRFYDARVLQLQGYTWGADMYGLQTAIDQLKGALALGSDHVFRFRREGFPEDEQVTFRVGDELTFTLAGSRRRVAWSVQLVCPDPRVYGAALKIASYDPTTAGAGTGLVFPLTFPLSFAGIGGTHLVCSNQGNFPSPPVLTITGPVTNPIIDEDAQGLSIYTTGLTLAAGDQLVIDVAAKTVTLAGGSRPDFIDAANTTWWELPRGDALLRLRGSGMVTGQTALQAAWRDARV